MSVVSVYRVSIGTELIDQFVVEPQVHRFIWMVSGIGAVGMFAGMSSIKKFEEFQWRFFSAFSFKTHGFVCSFAFPFSIFGSGFSTSVTRMLDRNTFVHWKSQLELPSTEYQLDFHPLPRQLNTWPTLERMFITAENFFPRNFLEHTRIDWNAVNCSHHRTFLVTQCLCIRYFWSSLCWFKLYLCLTKPRSIYHFWWTFPSSRPLQFSDILAHMLPLHWLFQSATQNEPVIYSVLFALFCCVRSFANFSYLLILSAERTRFSANILVSLYINI